MPVKHLDLPTRRARNAAARLLSAARRVGGLPARRLRATGRAAALAGLLLPAVAAAQDLDAPRPIDAGESLWTEELTWMEVRDKLADGWTTVVVGTGGVEQNGPYLVGGKHNLVLETVLPEIAREIGQALVAPVVKFVPEGPIEPEPGGHMRFPGTISVEPGTFHRLLSDIVRSYAAHGFTDIVLVGDSGGNQDGMAGVAEELNERWTREGAAARVHYLPEYYREDVWSYEFLKERGIVQIDETPGAPRDRPTSTRNGMHDDIYYTAQMAVQDPDAVRWDERGRAGLRTLHGVDLEPLDSLVALGRDLARYRAEITARAFRASMERLRGR